MRKNFILAQLCWDFGVGVKTDLHSSTWRRKSHSVTPKSDQFTVTGHVDGTLTVISLFGENSGEKPETDKQG